MKRTLDFEKIIAAAADLVAEKGYDKVTLNDIAERVGVKPPSLYNHLKSFDEVSEGLAKLALQKIDDVMRNAAVGKSRDEAVLQMALAYRQFAHENPELYKALMMYRNRGSEEVKSAEGEAVQVVYQVLRTYPLSEDEVIHYARAFRSSLHGFVSLEESGYFTNRVEVDESYRRMVTIFIHSMESREK